MSADQSSNPLDRLLQDVVSTVQTHQNHKPLTDKIVQVFKKYQPMVMSTTANLWYKKYELESEERRKLQKQLERAQETNRVLSHKMLVNQRLSLSDNSTAARMEAPRVNTLESDLVSSDEAIRSPPKKSEDMADGRQFTPFLAASDSKQFRLSIDDNSLNRDELKSCSICLKSLHPVYDELEEKNNRIKILNDVILRMNSKGQYLMSQSNLRTAENSRLEKINKELQDTVKLMEQHMAKIIQDSQSVRSKLQSSIEEQRRDIELLHLRIIQLEDEAKLLKDELTRSKKSQSHTKGRDESFTTVRESSSIIVKREHKDNKSLQCEPYRSYRADQKVAVQSKNLLPTLDCNEELAFERDHDVREKTSERTAVKRLSSEKPQKRQNPTKPNKTDQLKCTTDSIHDLGLGSKLGSSEKIHKRFSQSTAGLVMLDKGQQQASRADKNKKIHDDKNYICTLI